MAGAKSAVASRIKSLNRKCLYTHCYDHALNLCVKYTCNKVTCLKNTMDAAREICKLVKRSPRRESHLKKIRIEKGNKEENVQDFCPTCWTVQGSTPGSILKNHAELIELWEFPVDIVKDTEMKARIIGVQAIMKSFQLYFGCKLGERLLGQTDNLSRTLQNRDLSAMDTISLAEVVIKTLEKERSENQFELFWKKNQRNEKKIVDR